jgi:hypothetical protein
MHTSRGSSPRYSASRVCFGLETASPNSSVPRRSSTTLAQLALLAPLVKRCERETAGKAGVHHEFTITTYTQSSAEVSESKTKSNQASILCQRARIQDRVKTQNARLPPFPECDDCLQGVRGHTRLVPFLRVSCGQKRRSAGAVEAGNQR